MGKKFAFTLIELLVVVAVIGILISIMMPSISSARRSAMKAKAMTEMKSIETAIKSFYNEYGKLPAPSSVQQGGADVLPNPDNTEPDKEIIRILTATGKDGKAANPREIMFLEPQGSDQQGDFVDPWGKQYLIALDTDYDGKLTLLNQTVQRRQAVIAYGLYEREGRSDTNDLLRSWQ